MKSIDIKSLPLATCLPLFLLPFFAVLASCNKSDEIGGLSGTYKSVVDFGENRLMGFQGSPSGDGYVHSITFLPNGHMVEKKVQFEDGEIYHQYEIRNLYRLRGTTIETNHEDDSGDWSDEKSKYHIQGDGTIKDATGMRKTESDARLMPPAWGVFTKVTN